MKKLFFTAIALVAFSGVSMANTIEEKESIVIVADCATVANETLATFVMEEGKLTPEEEDYLWYSWYSSCLKSRKEGLK